MIDLDTMLKLAAATEDWTRVVHRCAWCQRFVDQNGAYTALVALDETTVVTDGMCAACGMRARVHLAARRRLRDSLAA